nr:hypothetical protein [Tropheryma whipplei]
MGADAMNRQSSFFPLLTGFFTYLFLLTRPHKRRLFMAGLVRKYYRDSTARTLIFDFYEYSVEGGILCLLLGVPSYIQLTEPLLLALVVALVALCVALIMHHSQYTLVLFDDWGIDKRSFLLRYSYYSQTPSFQNPTKRRQILLLDTVTRYGSKWSRVYVATMAVCIFFLVGTPISAWYLGALSFFACLFYTCFFTILPSIIFPFAFDGFPALLVRKLLYNLHIRRHGPIPKELTDMVTQAYEIYPERLYPWFRSRKNQKCESR